jgi:hypothetical protein
MLVSFCLGSRGLESKRIFTCPHGNFPTTLSPHLSWNHSPLSLVIICLVANNVFLLMYIEVLHFLGTSILFQIYRLTILMSHLHNTF